MSISASNWRMASAPILATKRSEPYSALASSQRMGLCLPGLALSHQLYLSLKSQGHGRDGTHALELALAKMAGIDWKNRT